MSEMSGLVPNPVFILHMTLDCCLGVCSEKGDVSSTSNRRCCRCQGKMSDHIVKRSCQWSTSAYAFLGIHAKHIQHGQQEPSSLLQTVFAFRSPSMSSMTFTASPPSCQRGVLNKDRETHLTSILFSSSIRVS